MLTISIPIYIISTTPGGFFKESYRSGATAGSSKGLTDEGGALMDTSREPPKRNVLTSIFYMLTKEAPIGFWHMNQVRDLRPVRMILFCGESTLSLTFVHFDSFRVTSCTTSRAARP